MLALFGPIWEFKQETASRVPFSAIFQTTVKRELLATLAGELDFNAAKQTADAVVALGLLLLDGKAADSKGGWSELLGTLQGWLTPQAAAPAVTRVAALQVPPSSHIETSNVDVLDRFA